jgi:hypothetical protein
MECVDENSPSDRTSFLGIPLPVCLSVCLSALLIQGSRSTVWLLGTRERATGSQGPGYFGRGGAGGDPSGTLHISISIYFWDPPHFYISLLLGPSTFLYLSISYANQMHACSTQPNPNSTFVFFMCKERDSGSILKKKKRKFPTRSFLKSAYLDSPYPREEEIQWNPICDCLRPL